MPSRLPDQNSTIMTYRGKALVAMHSENWAEARRSLDCMNKALDPDFRAKYSDEGYEQATVTKLTFRCRDCSTEYDRSEIRILPRFLTKSGRELFPTSWGDPPVPKIMTWRCTSKDCRAIMPCDGKHSLRVVVTRDIDIDYISNPRCARSGT